MLPSFRPTGDTVWKWTLRLAGLAGIIWETVVEKVDRPELLIVFAAMMGVDLVLKREGGSNGGGKNAKKPPRKPRD